jgi:membrane protease YdiL (CAAX protease family)
MSVPPVNGSEDLPSSEGRADESPGPPLRRVPNLAHALLFVSLAGLVLVLFELLASALGRFPATAEGAIHHPKLQIAIEASAYVATVLISSLFFPALWHRPFAIGLRGRWPAARGQAARLVGLGLMLGIMMQLVTSFVTPPKTMPIDEFFATAGDAWLITFFGTLVAPAFEEICFRGFLLPAFAIAYD